MPITITDGMFSQQWHLNQTVGGLFDLNVMSVWDGMGGAAYTGAGIRSFVIDDGFDYNHSDFDHYNQSLDYDYANNVADAFGVNGNNHGTAVMGLIGAARDGSGAVGVSFDSELVGMRIYGSISDAWIDDVSASLHNAHTNGGHTANISQGMANYLPTAFGHYLTQANINNLLTEIDNCVDLGRGGNGLIIVKSAGNSRTSDYDVAADNWTSDTQQVVVAAVNQDGFVSSYSSFGSSVLVSGFGTPGEVVTTDRVGTDGYNNTDFAYFNGTSAAAPMVTGVVNLMLDANDNLGWRDVQNILAYSARHVGSAIGGGVAGSEQYAWTWNNADNWNGGGLHFSNDYGYGLVDAHAAVRMSETWTYGGFGVENSASEYWSFRWYNTATTVPDGNATGVNFVMNETIDMTVERVKLILDFSTTYVGDLQIYVTAPDGSESIFYRNGLSGEDFSGQWTFESQAFRGVSNLGDWNVRVVDSVGGDVMTVSRIELQTYGSAPTANDRYVFTDELSDYISGSGHGAAIDTNGGIDTVNASAVTSNTTIILEDNIFGFFHSYIDGQTVTTRYIENAVTGDGNDWLSGSGVGNQMWGGRGNDTLYGNAGGDTLYGEWGDDFVQGGDQNDSMNGGDGFDTLSYEDHYNNWSGGWAIDMINGTADSWSYDGVNFTHEIDSFTAFEKLIASTGTDSIYAAAGNTIDGNAGYDYLYLQNTSSQWFGSAPADDIVYMTTGIVTTQYSFWLSGVFYYTVVTTFSNIEELYTQDGVDTVNGSANTDRVHGGNGADLLLGNGGADYLYGDADNDRINGGTGSDTMYGGSGDDDYWVDNATDYVMEYNGDGTMDRVFSSISYTLTAGSYVDWLGTTNLAGTGAINLTGNANNQSIYGNAGINILTGGGGDDRMYGFGGNDVYYVDSAADFCYEAAGGGSDRINTTVTYSLTTSQEIELLTVTNAASTYGINLYGNSYNQSIYGNDGANVIDGRGGADTMNGYGGSDIYYVDNIGDRVYDAAAGAGIDRVYTSVTHTLLAGQGIERLETTNAAGTTTIHLTGNEFGQIIIGNDGLNFINGGRGNDTLTGGLGVDTFIFDSTLNAVTNVDTITDFYSPHDSIRLDDAIFTALAPGALALNQFLSAAGATAATTATQRIVYNSSTGDLYYDADGVGGVGAIKFATLSGAPALALGDFTIV